MSGNTTTVKSYGKPTLVVAPLCCCIRVLRLPVLKDVDSSNRHALRVAACTIDSEFGLLQNCSESTCFDFDDQNAAVNRRRASTEPYMFRFPKWKTRPRNYLFLLPLGVMPASSIRRSAMPPGRHCGDGRRQAFWSLAGSAGIARCRSSGSVNSESRSVS